jgi:hypothetical protein
MLAWIYDRLISNICRHEWVWATNMVKEWVWNEGDIPHRRTRTQICEKCMKTRNVKV